MKRSTAQTRLQSGWHSPVEVRAASACQVRYLLCVFDSTSEIESSFATLRLFSGHAVLLSCVIRFVPIPLSGGIKGSMTPANADAYLKTWCDCPPLENIVFFDGKSYQLRPLYYKIIRQYKLVHGGSGCNTKKTRLPRRQFVSRKRKTGLKAFERRQQASQTGGEETLDLQALDAAAKSSARTRQTQAQVNLREAVQKLQADLWQDFTAGPLSGTAEKLKQHEKEQLQDKEKLERLEHRHLQEQRDVLPPGHCAFIVLGACKQAKTRVKKALLRLTVCGSVYGGSDFLNYISEESLLAKVGPKPLVYVCCDSSSFHRAIHPSVPKDDDIKEGCISLAMRVLGGFVATEQWVIHAAKRSHEPPAPILRLVPAYEQKIQFYVSDKVHDKMKAIISHLNNALAESIFASHVQWLMRERKSLLSSGSNKKFRQSVAVIVSHIFCLGWGCAGGPPGPTSVPCTVVGGWGPSKRPLLATRGSVRVRELGGPGASGWRDVECQCQDS